MLRKKIGISGMRSGSSTRRGVFFAALTAGALITGPLTGVAVAASGGPDSAGYTFIDSTEVSGPASGPFTSIAATGVDVGNHCDDCTTSVTLPFPVSFYDDVSSVLNVSSNGNIQFDSSSSTYSATGLPTSNFDTAMLVFQADLRTDVNAGDGIYTQTVGAAPNRQFIIEWDSVTYDTHTPEQFQVVLGENSPTVEFRYLDINAAEDHTTGIQGSDGSNGRYLQYNGGSDVANNLAVDFTHTNSRTVLVATPSRESTYGQNILLTATVTRTDGGSAAPTGSVTFYDNGAVLGTAALSSTGLAKLRTSKTVLGSNNLLAIYSGDANTTPSRMTISNYYVYPANTQTVISPPDGSTIAYGQPVIAKVTAVKPGAGVPSGAVDWYDDSTSQYFGSTPLRGGKATLPAADLPVGSYSLEADYQGNSDYNASLAAYDDVTVTQASTTTTLTSSQNPAPAGSKVSITATVTPQYALSKPTGTVTFFDNGSAIKTVPVNSKHQAVLSTTTLRVGNHPITATYNGDSNFTASTSAQLTETIS